MTEAGYCRVLLDIKDTKIMELESEITKLRIEYEKQIVKLQKEITELKERLLKVENAYKRKSEAEWRLNDLYQKVLTDFANAEKCSREYFTRYRTMLDFCIKAKEILREYIRINLLPPIERNFDDEVKLFKQAEQFCEEIN